MDMSWQIGGPAVGINTDEYSISYDDKKEFKALGPDHARIMLQKGEGLTPPNTTQPFPNITDVGQDNDGDGDIDIDDEDCLEWEEL